MTDQKVNILEPSVCKIRQSVPVTQYDSLNVYVNLDVPQLLF